jgi:tetratricopeptide (TPR) repeat protein
MRLSLLLCTMLVLSFPFTSALGAENAVQEGMVDLANQKFNDALKKFNLVLKSNPKSHQAYLGRGIVRYYGGSYDNALKDFNMAIENNPKYAEAHVGRGMVWYRKGEYRRAIADYRQALDLQPHNPKAMNQLAWTLAVCPDTKVHNPEEALDWARNASRLDMQPHYLDTLAAAYAANGKFKKAAETQKQAISMVVETNQEDKLDPYLARLKTYKANKPWVDIHKPGKPTTQSKLQEDDTKDRDINLQESAQEETTAPAKTATKSVPEPTAQSISKADTSGKSDLRQTTEATPAAPPGSGGIYPYPYTILIGQYQDQAQANSTALKFREKGDPAFISPVKIENIRRYQMLMGVYETRDQAEKAALALKERKFRRVEVVKRPYGVQVGVYREVENIENAEEILLSEGLLGYRIPLKDGKTRFMIGAYKNTSVPQFLMDKLRATGFSPIVTER